MIKILFTLGFVLMMNASVFAAQNSEVYPISYGMSYFGSLKIDGFRSNQTHHAYAFEGTAGDVIRVIFEHTALETGQSFMYVVDLSTNSEYEGIPEEIGFGILYESQVLRNFRLPTTGQYGLIVGILNSSDSWATEYVVTIDLDSMLTERERRELSIYRLAYMEQSLELGAIHGSLAYEAPIVMLRSNDSSAEQVTGSGQNGYCPSFTPDGQAILYGRSTNRNLFTNEIIESEIIQVDVSSGTRRTLLTGLHGDVGYTRMSPNGSSLVFHMSQDEGRTYEIYLYDLERQDLRPITDLNARSRYPSWSPNGDQIVFHSDVAGNYDIYTMDRDGNNVMQLTHQTHDESRAVFSPDGQIIAYAQNLSEDIYEVFLMQHDGEGQGRISNWGGFTIPVGWTPDGNWLVVESNIPNLQVNVLYFVSATDGNRPPIRMTNVFQSVTCASVSQN